MPLIFFVFPQRSFSLVNTLHFSQTAVVGELVKLVNLVSPPLSSHQTCEQRQVSHLQYLSWPDYGVPTSAVTLIDFLGAVKRQQRKMVKSMGSQWSGHPLGPPMVVHCSAGIGRTGERQCFTSTQSHT